MSWNSHSSVNLKFKTTIKILLNLNTIVPVDISDFVFHNFKTYFSQTLTLPVSYKNSNYMTDYSLRITQLKKL